MKNFFKKEGMNQKIRRLLALPLCLLTLLGATLPARAASYSTVAVRYSDGVTAAAEPSYLIGGVTYVPFRAFCNRAENGRVSWDGATKTATATMADGRTVRAQVGKEYLSYGERCFYTAAPIRLIGEKLYVPVRPLSACFGITVQWQAADRSVKLTRTGQIPRHDSGVYNADELYWLSRIISAESKSEPFRGQIAVGNVVLNRVASPQFPNSIYAVIFDRKHGVQFSPTVNGSIHHTPSADAVRAAKICLEGVTLSPGILYFFNPRIAQSHWISKNRTYAFRIGGHEFYY